jgi:hypothetical protein
MITLSRGPGATPPTQVEPVAQLPLACEVIVAWAKANCVDSAHSEVMNKPSLRRYKFFKLGPTNPFEYLKNGKSNRF